MPATIAATHAAPAALIRTAVCCLIVFKPFSGSAQTVNVDVNINMIHDVGGITTFDRSKFITIHADHFESDWDDGVNGANNAVADLRDDFLNGRDVYLGRATGYITWYLNNQITEDPTKPGWANPASIVSNGLSARNNYNVNKTASHPYEARNSQVAAAQFSPFWPDGTTTNNGWAFSQTDTVGEPFGTATGDFIGRFMDEFYDNGGTQAGPPSPAFFEVINEPEWHLIDNGSEPPINIWNFHKNVATQIRTHNTHSLIGGYCPAFIDPDEDNFQEWYDEWKLFIDTAGAEMDFWSVHFYDFPAFGNLQRYRSGSHFEATFDIIDYYSEATLGVSRPYVVSEYNAQTHNYNNDDWSSWRDWLKLKAHNSMLLTFMDRPHLMLKTIPFVLVKAEWGRNQTTGIPYGPRLMRQANEPSSYTGDWVYTDLVKFYDLWSDVNGTRVNISSSDPDIQTYAFVDGDKVFVIINNLVPGERTVDVDLFEIHGNTVQSVREKNLYWNGSAVTLDDTVTAGNVGQIEIGSEGAVILEYTMASSITLDQTITESKHFATTYLQTISSGVTDNFTINGVAPGANGKAELRIGIARAHGLSKQPTVLINGTAVSVPVDIFGRETDARWQFFGMLQIPVPYELLLANNTISVTFPDSGGHITTVALRNYISDSSLIPVPSSLAADQTLPVNNFNPRDGAIHPQLGSIGQGGGGIGMIEYYAGGPNSGNIPTALTNSPARVDFQWTGLDLDGIGGANDVIYFTMVAHGSTNDYASFDQVQASSLGWGVMDPYLDQDESLRYTVEDVYLSAGTAGSVSFDGFTGGNVIKSFGSGATTSGIINGLPFTVTNADALYSLHGSAFPAAAEVAFKTLVKGGITVSVRDFDLQFSYYPEQPASSYQLWAESHSLSGPDALVEADPDLDGILNMGEYAHGGEPNDDLLRGFAPSLLFTGSSIDFTHTFRIDALDEFTFTVEETTSLLGSWSNAAGSTIKGINAAGVGFSQFTHEIPAVVPNKYYRLRIESK